MMASSMSLVDWFKQPLSSNCCLRLSPSKLIDFRPSAFAGGLFLVFYFIMDLFFPIAYHGCISVSVNAALSHPIYTVGWSNAF